MFYMVLIIFHFSFLLVKCEKNVSAVMPAEEMPKTSIELMTERVGETMVKLDTKQFSRQARFISTLRTLFDGIRFLVKTGVNSYNWYYPELTFGNCVMKYTRTLYPELMQMRLSYENVTKYLQSLYFAIYGYIIGMINENRQDIQSEQYRIGTKVAEMTLHDVSSSSSLLSPSISPAPGQILLSTAAASSSSSISSPRPINHVKSSLSNYNDDDDDDDDGNFNYMEKFGTFFSPNHRAANHHHHHQLNRKFGTTQNYENELAVAQSFNDFSPMTRSMDITRFDKNNNFPSNSINPNEYDANKSYSLATENLFDLEKFETKHSANYYVPAADSSSSSSSSSSPSTTTTSATDENGKFSEALAVLENNLNAKESHKPNKFSVMYVGPRQFTSDYQDDTSSSLDDAPTLDLDKNANNNDEKGAGDDDSNIFDFENVIWESFGFNAKAVKSSSLIQCMRGYVIDIFRRTFEYFVLM